MVTTRNEERNHRRIRRCSICHQTGHNQCSCRENQAQFCQCAIYGETGQDGRDCPSMVQRIQVVRLEEEEEIDIALEMIIARHRRDFIFRCMTEEMISEIKELLKT
eukprot:13283791-Ditylum_brightwellii.AAC.1